MSTRANYRRIHLFIRRTMKKLIFLSIFILMGIIIARAQTVTNEQIQLLQNSITQSQQQAQIDQTDISLDQSDINAKTSDWAQMNAQIQAAESFLNELAQTNTVDNSTDNSVDNATSDSTVTTNGQKVN